MNRRDWILIAGLTVLAGVVLSIVAALALLAFPEWIQFVMVVVLFAVILVGSYWFVLAPHRLGFIGAEGSKPSTGVDWLSEKVEKSFTVLVLLLSTGALQSEVIVSGATHQNIWYGVYGATLSLVAARWKRFIYVAKRDKLLLLLVGLLVGLALVSVLWSVSPQHTLGWGSGYALVGTTLIGIYLAVQYSLSEQLRLLAWALGIAALLSLLFALALPSYGISSGIHEGAWQGIFVHKNTLGRLMALSAVVFLLLALSGSKYHRLAWTGFVLSVVLLVLSDSKTGLIICLTLLLFLPLYNVLRKLYTLSVPAFIALVLLGGGAAAFLLYNAELLLGLLGRDATLTGRTELWAVVLEMIRESPWLGYGYGAFWASWAGVYTWILVNWVSYNAHNGFLDLWLDLGLLGVVVFVLGFLISWWRAVVWARLSETAEGFWPVAYLTFMLLYNFVESTLLTPNSIFWILYVAVALSTFVPRRGVQEQAVAK